MSNFDFFLGSFIGDIAFPTKEYERERRIHTTPEVQTKAPKRKTTLSVNGDQTTTIPTESPFADSRNLTEGAHFLKNKTIAKDDVKATKARNRRAATARPGNPSNVISINITTNL